MKKKLLMTALAGAALLAACGATPAAPPTVAPTVAPATKPAATAAPAATNAPAAPAAGAVRVGYVPVSINYPFYVALEKGYFKEQGLTVELLPTDGGSDAVVQVASGNFEASGSGIAASMLTAVQRGIEFEIAASLPTERPKVSSPLVVSKKRFDSGELTKIADLKGKKVATNNRGTATEWWLYSALQKGGLDVKDVEIIGMPFQNIGAALENGGLDGAILTEPFATAAEDKGIIKRLSEDFITDFYPTYVYFNKKWSTDNPAKAQGFVKAFLKAARDLQGDKRYDPANLAILSKWTKTDVEVLKRLALPYFDPNGGVPIADIMTLQTFYRKQGLLNYPTDLDMNKFVNRGYVETALKEMGKVEMK
jgi:NitT/TauT family transport system substrate-binding protein